MPDPTLCHITGKAFAVGQTGSSVTYARKDTSITIIPVAVPGVAVYSGYSHSKVGDNGAVDFYVLKQARIKIRASIMGFVDETEVQIPNEDEYDFESLVNIALSPAAFGNPMLAPGDLIFGSTGGAATRLAGNLTATKKFLSQTGTGSASATPAWAVPALDDLSDVVIASPQDGQRLVYNAGTGKFENQTVVGGEAVWGSVTGTLSSQTDLQTALDAKQAAFGNQSANRIFAGPSTGGAAAPTFRALVAADIPNLSSVYQTALGFTAENIANKATDFSTLNNSLYPTVQAVSVFAAANYQPLSSNLTTFAAIAPSANVQTLLGAANFSAFRSSLGVAIGSNVQAWDADLDAIAALSGTSGLLKKTAANTWTLDTSTYATQAYADALVMGLLDDRGNYDASGNVFPSSDGSGSAGAILKGDLWTISVAGTLGGVAVTAGDVVRALADSPGQTASNWAISENNIGYAPLNAALASGKFYVGNGSGIGTAVTPSGDVTFDNAGVFAIGSAKVTNAMLAGSIDLTSKVTGALPLANGGLGASLTDPNANTLLGWDDTDNAVKFLTIGSGLSYDHSTHTLSASGGSGANTALSNLASVAINTDLLPASTQSLGSASFPFLSSFIGNTTQYESVSQSAGLITHAALGSATNIGIVLGFKGVGTIGIGGGTSSFPGFWQSGGVLYVVTATNSAGAPIDVKEVRVATGVTGGLLESSGNRLSGSNTFGGFFVTNSAGSNFTNIGVKQLGLWSLTGAEGTNDTAIARAAAGVAKLTDGSTGGAAFEFKTMTAPASPATGSFRFYAKDNGSGKVLVVVKFSDGTETTLATQP